MILSSITNNTHDVLIRSIVVVFPYDKKDARTLLDMGSPYNYISPPFAAWLQREGYEKEPSIVSICSPLSEDACVCSEFKINFKISISKPDEDIILLFAAFMPLATHDIIIGYATISKHNLLEKVWLTIPTVFPINSYVLVDYIYQPPTTLHAPLEGPIRVVRSKNGQYTLQSIVTDKLNEYHVSRLRQFYYDQEDMLVRLRIVTPNSGMLIP